MTFKSYFLHFIQLPILIFFHLQDGDRRAAGHFCQHAWCVLVPAGGFISLCCCQQPQEAGMMCTRIFGNVSLSELNIYHAT